MVDGQAELFGGLRQSTDTIVASNQHIAEKAAETLANAATAQEEVKASGGEIDTALSTINALVDSVRAIGSQRKWWGATPALTSPYCASRVSRHPPFRKWKGPLTAPAT